MNPDLNKYLDAARAQCEVNRAKWGKQSDEVLYCVLTEQWGQFVRAINRWRFPGRGGHIVEVQDTAKKALAVLVDMDFIRESDTFGPEEMQTLSLLVGSPWHRQMRVGSYYIGDRRETIHLRASIAGMLVKALCEEASGVKS